MARTPKTNVSIIVALAGLPAMILLVRPSPAQAQFQVGGNGHLLDANPQVGSGGLNGPSNNNQVHQGPIGTQQGGINNNITYGNVSGLNGFQGRVRSFDPTQFQGRTGTYAVDRLDGIAAPVDLTQRTTGSPTFTPYYNAATYAPTPNAAANSTLVPTPGGIGFIPAASVNPLTPGTDDVRLEMTNTDPNMINTLPAPGELNVAGPVDPSGNASMYSMSPLYGVRQSDNQTASGADTFFSSRQTNATMQNGTARTRLTSAQIQSMREELNKTVVPDGQNGDSNTAPGTPQAGTAGAGTPGAGATNLDSSGQVSGQPITGQVSAQPISGAVGGAQATPGDLSTGQGVQSQLLIPATNQSKQLKALEDKYAKINHKLTDVEASDKLNAEIRAKTAAANDVTKKPANSTAAPGSALPGGLAPGGGSLIHEEPTTKPGLKSILTPADNSAADNQSVVVTSLASGIQAKGLADLMKSAEDKMRQGKFTEAVDSYETAQSVAPNNPLISLGRSFAELGASYYGKADQDLTRAIIADPAVLAGKYDLNGFLGEDRVKFVSGDLTDIAGHGKSGRPLVLLAFIAHNNGDDKGAASYLDQAAPRGGYDSLIALMRSTWGLKTDVK